MPTDRTTSRRRGFLTAAATGIAGWVTRAAQAQAERRTTMIGEPITEHVRVGEPDTQPLDTTVLFERKDRNDVQKGTHEVLSLLHQEMGSESFPWTLYASLETHHEGGDACVVCSRLHKHGPGWSTGLHSEVFAHHRAVALGANIEMSCDYQGPEALQVIGLNIQAVGGPAPMQYGIQIHEGAGRFERAIGLNGTGLVGLDLAGEYDAGIHTHDNDVILNEGACVALDGKGEIRVRYREGWIEFLNGDRCFGRLDVNGEDHIL